MNGRKLELLERYEGIYKCPDCTGIFDDEELCQGRIYECGECGEFICEECDGTRRCEQCNKFAARFGEKHCPDCGAQTSEPLIEVPAFQNPEDGFIYISYLEVKDG